MVDDENVFPVELNLGGFAALDTTILLPPDPGEHHLLSIVANDPYSGWIDSDTNFDWEYSELRFVIFAD